MPILNFFQKQGHGTPGHGGSAERIAEDAREGEGEELLWLLRDDRHARVLQRHYPRVALFQGVGADEVHIAVVLVPQNET
jgi:hypothetical protein